MTRVKRSNIARKRRKKVLKLTQGFTGRPSTIFRTANIQKIKALSFSFRDRNTRKREFRMIWIARLNAAVRIWGLKYSEFFHILKKSNTILNRKILAQLVIRDQNAFSQLIQITKK